MISLQFCWNCRKVILNQIVYWLVSANDPLVWYCFLLLRLINLKDNISIVEIVYYPVGIFILNMGQEI